MNEPAENIVVMQGIVKDFPGVRALDDVDFHLHAGEIHGLVGENGAGKSTLIKILAGVYERDEGSVEIRGENYASITPHLVENLGIQFIHQERYLVPQFTVAESIFLGHEKRFPNTFFVNNGAMRSNAEEFIGTSLGIDLPGNLLIRDLTIAQAQIVQIAKALIAKPSIIVLDEPTAPLARREVERLFTILRRLKQQGITILYISHYLQEISEICDRVTVLRNGRNVGTLTVRETKPEAIVELMVGRELREMFPTRQIAAGETILEVDRLSLEGAFDSITFSVHRGEVVGLTGLLGSGREALVNTLFGLLSPDAGSITIQGKKATRLSPVQAVRRGLALVPRDRRQQGLVIEMSVSDNINLASLDRVSRGGFVRQAAARDRSNAMIESLDIKTPSADEIVRYLSGGNQQKVVVARWLGSDAEVYLLDEPTVGIDVGAKVEIYHLINRLVAEGAGVLFVSSDIPELIGMTDRILVMYRGSVVKTFESKETSPDVLLGWAIGGQRES